VPIAFGFLVMGAVLEHYRF